MARHSILSSTHAHFKEQIQICFASGVEPAPSYSQVALPSEKSDINAQFKDYIGKALQDEERYYQIKPSCLDVGDLVVFPAVSSDGTLCEAQCFKKYKLPNKLYIARKRRIQRLMKSSNLMDVINQEDVRIIVSRVPRHNAGTTDGEAENEYTCRIEDFPPLYCSGKKENIPTKARSDRLGTNEVSFTKATSCWR